MAKLRVVILVLNIFIPSIIISILYLDRPIALFMHSSGLDLFLQLRYITEKLPYIIVLAIIVVIILSENIASWRQKIAIMIYFYLSLYITIRIKDLLKMLFGRYWPKTWIHNNLSLINNNVYGFNFFHGSATIGAFPSGHSACVAFCVMWLIKFLPQARIIFIVCGLFVPTSLIILDYHFLSDCLAGILLGVVCAIISESIMFSPVFKLVE